MTVQFVLPLDEPWNDSRSPRWLRIRRLIKASQATEEVHVRAMKAAIPWPALSSEERIMRWGEIIERSVVTRDAFFSARIADAVWCDATPAMLKEANRRGLL